MNKVAALYVDPNGPYSDMGIVDTWDESRDARLYDGPDPVVAHPPCNRWGKMAPINLKRWGTPIGEDGGCFEKSLEKPQGLSWTRVSPTEWVGEVWQSDYGHLATKKTWLLYVGNKQPDPYKIDRRKGTHQVGGGIHTGNNKKPRLNQSVTHLTPPEFAKYLVRLARDSNL